MLANILHLTTQTGFHFSRISAAPVEFTSASSTPLCHIILRNAQGKIEYSWGTLQGWQTLPLPTDRVQWVYFYGFYQEQPVADVDRCASVRGTITDEIGKENCTWANRFEFARFIDVTINELYPLRFPGGCMSVIERDLLVFGTTDHSLVIEGILTPLENY
jgi:hypothetical protein